MDELAKRVDEGPCAVPAAWVCDDSVTAGFDSLVRKSPAFYDQVQQMVVDISEFFIRDGSRVYDIGPSTGETLRRLKEKHAARSGVQFIGIEQSLPTIREGERPDMVLSLFTLHFLDPDAKCDLIRRIHRDLRPGGVLMYVDKVFAEHGAFERLWTEVHWDHKRSPGLADEMMLAKARSLRSVLTPMSVTENLSMLRRVGFTADVFFKVTSFVGFLAIKSGPSTGAEREEEQG